MSAQLQPIREWHDVDARMFREEIVPRYQPAVMRGLVGHWPAVQRAKESLQSIGQYLADLDNGTPVDAVMTRPE
jgi:hypothetical protein